VAEAYKENLLNNIMLDVGYHDTLSAALYVSTLGLAVVISAVRAYIRRKRAQRCSSEKADKLPPNATDK
jgi:hypothetical protein